MSSTKVKTVKIVRDTGSAARHVSSTNLFGRDAGHEMQHVLRRKINAVALET
jgi:hypothetical protein